MVAYFKQLKAMAVLAIRHFKRIIKSNKNKLYLSFGENCLTDEILSRYNLKSFSTPFSSGRSNIEYVLQIEKDEYKDFLNPDFMKYGIFNEKNVVRLTKYNEIKNQYHYMQMEGFEFSHHDVLNNLKMREKIDRRVKRLLEAKNKEVNIFYHHRYCVDTNEDMLIRDLAELKDIYEGRNNKVNIFMFIY